MVSWRCNRARQMAAAANGISSALSSRPIARRRFASPHPAGILSCGRDRRRRCRDRRRRRPWPRVADAEVHHGERRRRELRVQGRRRAGHPDKEERPDVDRLDQMGAVVAVVGRRRSRRLPRGGVRSTAWRSRGGIGRVHHRDRRTWRGRERGLRHRRSEGSVRAEPADGDSAHREADRRAQCDGG